MAAVYIDPFVTEEVTVVVEHTANVQYVSSNMSRLGHALDESGLQLLSERGWHALSDTENFFHHLETLGIVRSNVAAS